MSNSEFGLITVQLFLLIALAHLCGHLFTRLRQQGLRGRRGRSVLVLDWRPALPLHLI